MEVQQPIRRCTAWPQSTPLLAYPPTPRYRSAIFKHHFSPNHIDLCSFPPIFFIFLKCEKTNEKLQTEVEEKVEQSHPADSYFFSLVERKLPATVSLKVRCHPRAAAASVAAADEWSNFWHLAPIRMQPCFLSSGLALPSWTNERRDGGRVQPVRGSSHDIRHTFFSHWKWC